MVAVHWALQTVWGICRLANCKQPRAARTWWLDDHPSSVVNSGDSLGEIGRFSWRCGWYTTNNIYIYENEWKWCIYTLGVILATIYENDWTWCFKQSHLDLDDKRICRKPLFKTTVKPVDSLPDINPWAINLQLFQYGEHGEPLLSMRWA